MDESLTQARTSISLGQARTLEWVTPVLYMRAPNGVLFDLPLLSTIVPPPGQQPVPAQPATGAPSAATGRPAAPPIGSAPPQPGWGYSSPSGPPQAPVYVPVAPKPPVSAPLPRKRSGAGRGLVIGLVVVLLIGACSEAGFGVFKLFSGIQFSGVPRLGGSTPGSSSAAHFHVTPTSVSVSACSISASGPSHVWCQVTLVNENASQTLNWNATSSDPSITFLPGSSGFITGGNSWPVQIVVPTNPCPPSATATFHGPVNDVMVSVNCS